MAGRLAPTPVAPTAAELDAAIERQEQERAPRFDFRGAREAIYLSALGPYERAVLTQIVEHQPNARPSVRRIAARAGISERRAQYALRQIELAGVIRVKRGGGRGNPSAYYLRPGWEQIAVRGKGAQRAPNPPKGARRVAE